MMVNASHGAHATPNLRHLMLFDQVARRGSVSAAARASHLSQPAVTQAVGQIEAAFGARLMQRSYSGLALTGEGRAAAQRVERALAMLRDALVAVRARAGNAASADVLRGITTTQLHALIAVVEEGAFARAARRAEIAQAQAEVAAAQGTGSGSTVIGAMPLARSVLVPRAVLEFAALRPEHAISILDGPYESMLAALRRGSADVLIGALRDPIPFDDIVQEHLFDDPLAIVVGRRHPLVGGGAPTLAALSRFPWIAPRRDSPLRRHFDALIERLGAQPTLAPIECNSLVAARSLLLASDRVMLSSEHQIHHELKTGQLGALPHPFGEVTRSIGLTVRRDWRPTQVQSQLVEGLRRHARAARALASRGNPATE